MESSAAFPDTEVTASHTVLSKMNNDKSKIIEAALYNGKVSKRVVCAAIVNLVVGSTRGAQTLRDVASGCMEEREKVLVMRTDHPHITSTDNFSIPDMLGSLQRRFAKIRAEGDTKHGKIDSRAYLVYS